VDDLECEVGLVIVERLKVFSCITPDGLSLHRVAVDWIDFSLYINWNRLEEFIRISFTVGWATERTSGLWNLEPQRLFSTQRGLSL